MLALQCFSSTHIRDAGVEVDDIFASVRAEMRILETEGITVIDCVTGLEVTLGGQIAFIKSDMPQGCEIAGHVGPKGNKLCRSCTISKQQASDQTFDVFVNQRQQAQNNAIRVGMHELKTLSAIKKQTTNTG